MLQVAAPRPCHAPQHFLNFLPLPQGQGSFRPDLVGDNRTVLRFLE